MLPIKTRSIFKSRWMALLWAGGILWSAAQFAQSQPHKQAPAGNSADASSQTTDSDGNPVTPADIQAAKAAVAAFGQ